MLKNEYFRPLSKSVLICTFVFLMMFTSTMCFSKENRSEDKMMKKDSDTLVFNRATDFNLDQLKAAIPSVRVEIKSKVREADKDIIDQSCELQAKIDSLSYKGGGTIYFNKGIYYLKNITVKSNILLLLNKDAIIRLYLLDNKNHLDKNYSIFYLGGNKKDLTLGRNIGIAGDDGMTKIELPFISNHVGVKAINMSYVNNFVIQNLDIYMQKTEMCAIASGGVYLKDGSYYVATNGLLKNLTAHGCHFGYGLYQCRGARNVHSENFDCEGGVAWRMESGYIVNPDNKFGVIYNCTAKNIVCRNGACAVMISPHTNKNGLVQATDITAISCGFGILVGRGFVNKKNAKKYRGITPGYFDSKSFVKNIKVIAGENAQIRHQEINSLITNNKNLPASYKKKFANLSAGSKFDEHLPSIAPVEYFTRRYNVTISGLTSEGFNHFDDLPYHVQGVPMAVDPCPDKR